MPIKRLICPLNENNIKPGPITNTFYSQYHLTAEEIRLYEKLAPLPKPSIRRRAEKNTPQSQPDFHPVDCPAQFPSEPE